MSTEEPTRWRSTRADAAAIRECARSYGVSERSARAWRRANDGRWLKFLSARAGSSLGQLEAAALRTDLETSTPEAEERAALRRFKLIEAEITRALDRGELSSIPTITKAAADSHKLLCQCREATESWRVRSRDLIPAAEITDIQERYLHPIFSAIAALPDEIAAEANPADPSVAMLAIRGWLTTRFKPLYEAACGVVHAAQQKPARDQP